MQKLIKTFSVIVAVLTVFGAVRRINANRDVLRLHVIANSDSAEDQAVKYAVRDALLACGTLHMQDVRSEAEAETVVLAQGAELQTAADAELARLGAGYCSQLYLGEFSFPVRDYGGVLYPAGEYRALRVVLGEGKGQNWWCVMFPPLCIGELSNGEIDNETAGFKSLIAELSEQDGGNLWEKLKEKLR